MRKVKLSECGNYVLSPKISTSKLTSINYITTDNMLPNKAGVKEAENVPIEINVTEFTKNDILLTNKNYRQIFVANYVIVYKVDEESKNVIVMTVKYVRGDF